MSDKQSEKRHSILADAKFKNEIANQSYLRIFSRQLCNAVRVVVNNACTDCSSRRGECQFAPCPRARKVASILAELLTRARIREN